MTRDRTDKMHIGAFFKNTGHHLASWRHPDAQPDAGINIAHYMQCAQMAEQAGFDFLFFADSSAVREAPAESLSRSSQFTAYFEPITLLAALSAVTTRIGLVATASTSFNDPYTVARKFASLDHLSGGRAGWNAVTSGMPQEALNFSLDAHYGHADRYRRAMEFVEVVTRLWDSWDDDAFLYDQRSGRFLDPEKMHRLDHVGEFYRVRGPLNVPRSPQGRPVIFEAGISDEGRELAAASAEGVFTAALSLESSAAHYADTKGRMARYGRQSDEMVVLPGVTVMIGATEAEAREKEEYLAGLIHPSVGMEYISGMLKMDLTGLSPDDHVPDRPTVGELGKTHEGVRKLAHTENLTLGQLYRRLAGSFGKLVLRGTPSQIADEFERWFSSHACDGFILQPNYMPGDLDDICRLLIPELQDRGLIRAGYQGETLREHMGLARPASIYSPVSV